MLVRLLQRFSGIRLRQDAHPASMPPPGVERSDYAVDGRERVWMRSHLTAYAKVRPTCSGLRPWNIGIRS